MLTEHEKEFKLDQAARAVLDLKALLTTTRAAAKMLWNDTNCFQFEAIGDETFETFNDAREGLNEAIRAISKRYVEAQREFVRLQVT